MLSFFQKYKSKGSGVDFNEYNSTRNIHDTRLFCHAPHSNLFFGMDGKVTACCFNRRHLLGTIPDQSIEEILRGRELKALKNSIRHNDLSMGCTICSDHLYNHNFGAIGAKNYDSIPFSRNYPAMMEFELSNACNFQCTMCSGFFSSTIEKKTGKTVRQNLYDHQFVEQLKKYLPHLYKAGFYGGEPMVIDLYYDIWEQITNLNPGCIIFVQTNASVLTSRMKVLMEKGNFHFNISIDALDKEIFESIRRGSDFNKVTENTNYLVDYCKSKNSFIGISACLIKQNWKEIPRLVNYYNERNIPLYFNTVRFPLSSAIWCMEATAIAEMAEQFKNSRYQYTTGDIQNSNMKAYYDMINQLNVWYKDALERERNHCSDKELKALKEDILKRIRTSVNNSKIFEGISKEEITGRCIHRLENIFGMFPQGFHMHSVYLTLKLVSPERFISDLENETEDYNFERISNQVYFNKTMPDEV